MSFMFIIFDTVLDVQGYNGHIVDFIVFYGLLSAPVLSNHCF